MARFYLMTGGTSLLVFLAIAALVLSNATQSEDAQLASAINHFDVGALASVLVFFAEYGREYFWIPLVGLMLLFGSERTRLLAIELAVLFLVGVVVGDVMKVAVFRPRPFESVDAIVTRVPADLDSSFPSGHALIVSIGAAFATLRFKRKIVGLLFVLEAAIVCYSRVYVGVHYPLDVMAGVFLGIGVVGIGLFFVEKYLGTPLSKCASLVTNKLREGPLDL